MKNKVIIITAILMVLIIAFSTVILFSIHKGSNSVKPNLFNKYSGNPMLSEGTFASVVKLETLYYMFYHNLSDNTICRAYSLDGKNFTDDANNPILTPGEWNYSKVGVPSVWIENGTWHMLFRCCHSSGHKVYHATSLDGVHWTGDPYNPIFEDNASWIGKSGIEAWGIIKINDTYHMFYSDWKTPRQIGRAVSTDLHNWTKDSANPIFGGGRFCPWIFKCGHYYYLLVPHYTLGTDYTEFELYRDFQPSFHPSNREFVGIVLSCSPSGWDSHDIDTPCVLTDDETKSTFNASNNELWMYYAGESVGLWKTGLTVDSDIDATLTNITEKISNKR